MNNSSSRLRHRSKSHESADQSSRRKFSFFAFLKFLVSVVIAVALVLLVNQLEVLIQAAEEFILHMKLYGIDEVNR